jgi:hypothetical protein
MVEKKKTRKTNADEGEREELQSNAFGWVYIEVQGV